jgi:multiple sugar transport system ATP-binding protein
MNFVPATITNDQLELPFVTLDLSPEWKSAVEDRQLLIAGIRPGAFDDAKVIEPSKAERGVTFDVRIDVSEWLGNEQYAFVPYSAPAEITAQLAQLASELDSEQLRTQICVELDPSSRVRPGETARIWLDPSKIHLFDPATGDNLTRTNAHV